MKQENAIEVKDVHKSFKVFFDRSYNLKDFAIHRKRRNYENRSVLNGISFSVKKGEAVGLIGHNGCGKSTTLKLLTRIMYPDSGTIEMNGRVSSLIELGAGFHPDMSGRENIYINASIFGLSKKEIDRRLDDIIAFSELEEFIDNPVRTYSSGMYMRLAFSVAINVDADILLIDEILAVGDAAFQAKCFNRMQEIKASGTTIVLVSHAMGSVEQFCDRAIWIHEGKVKDEGNPKEVGLSYMTYASRVQEEQMAKRKAESAVREEREAIEEESPADAAESVALNNMGECGEADRPTEDNAGDTEEKSEQKEKKKNRWGNNYARITEVHVNKKGMRDCRTIFTGDDMELEVWYKVTRPVKNAVFGLGIFRIDGVQCYGTNTQIDRMPEFDLTEDGCVRILLRNVNLLKGVYTFDLAIEQGQGMSVDYYRKAAQIEVISSTFDDIGVLRIEHDWEMEQS